MQWDKLYYVGGDARQSGIMQGEIVVGSDTCRPEAGPQWRWQDTICPAGRVKQGIRMRSSGRTVWSEPSRNRAFTLEKLSYQFANWNRGQAENKMTAADPSLRGRVLSWCFPIMMRWQWGR